MFMLYFINFNFYIVIVKFLSGKKKNIILVCKNNFIGKLEVVRIQWVIKSEFYNIFIFKIVY